MAPLVGASRSQELGKAIPELVDVLKLERSNLDAVCDALETLYLICKPVPPEVLPPRQHCVLRSVLNFARLSLCLLL